MSNRFKPFWKFSSKSRQPALENLHWSKYVQQKKDSGCFYSLKVSDSIAEILYTLSLPQNHQTPETKTVSDTKAALPLPARVIVGGKDNSLEFCVVKIVFVSVVVLWSAAHLQRTYFNKHSCRDMVTGQLPKRFEPVSLQTCFLPNKTIILLNRPFRYSSS